MKNENKPESQKNLSRRLVLVALGLLAPTTIFLLLASHIKNGPVLGEAALLTWLHQFSTPALDSFAIFITTLGNAPVVIAGVTTSAAAMFMARWRHESLFLLLSAGGTELINLALKQTFDRARPDFWQHIVTEADFSFPSGHAMIASTLAFTAVALCWHTRWRWAAILGSIAYCLAISLSRLYLGVHFPSDIVAGWCVSLLWVFALYKAFGRFMPFAAKN